MPVRELWPGTPSRLEAGGLGLLDLRHHTQCCGGGLRAARARPRTQTNKLNIGRQLIPVPSIISVVTRKKRGTSLAQKSPHHSIYHNIHYAKYDGDYIHEKSYYKACDSGLPRQSRLTDKKPPPERPDLTEASKVMKRSPQMLLMPYEYSMSNPNPKARRKGRDY